MPAASEAQQKQPSVEKKRLLVEGQGKDFIMIHSAVKSSIHKKL